MDVFVITFITCTMTAFVVTVTGSWDSGLTSTALVASAFNREISVAGGWMVALSSLLFGYSNLIGWAYYGEVCFRYLFHSRVVRLYAWVYCGLILRGAVAQVRTVWDYADTMNGLRAKGVQVTTDGSLRMVDGKLVGRTIARYSVKTADSVRYLIVEATRKP